MAPELVPITPTHNLQIWLDFAKIAIPPLITGAVVIRVAQLTYQYANKGRKEDILYKERYKGFEAISSYAHSMESKIDKLEHEMISYMGRTFKNTEDRTNAVIKMSEEYYRLFSIPEIEIPNMTHTALMRKETRKEFIQLSQWHSQLLIFLHWNTLEAYHKDSPLAANPKELIDEIIHYIHLCRVSINNLIKLAFEDIDLPER